MMTGDVSVTAVEGVSVRRQAAKEAGYVAEVRERSKRRKYETENPNAVNFMPLVQEAHGRLGKGALSQVKSLAKQAYNFIGYGLQLLPVALCRGNALVFRRLLAE